MGGKDTVEMPADKASQLERAEMLEECKIKLQAWAKWYFGFVVLGVSVLGIFGFQAVLRMTVDDVVKDAVGKGVGPYLNMAQTAAFEAGVTSRTAEEMAQDTRVVAADMRKQVKALGEQVDEVGKRALELDRQLSGANAQLEAELEGQLEELISDVALLRTQLKDLGELIPTIVSDRTRAEDYSKALREALDSAKTIRKAISKNSEYLVLVHYAATTRDLASDALVKLRKRGFRASLVAPQFERRIAAQMKLPFGLTRPARINRIVYTMPAKDALAEIEDVLKAVGIRIEERREESAPLLKTDNSKQIDVYLVH